MSQKLVCSFRNINSITRQDLLVAQCTRYSYRLVVTRPEIDGVIVILIFLPQKSRLVILRVSYLSLQMTMLNCLN